ncbi:MAG: MerR family transcriptional regulator [Syntrophomonas sp.]|nr:MerR family transcriptional regulator [Syntrophomonas sp.]
MIDFILYIGYSKGEILVVDVSRNQPVYNISVAAELVGVHPRTLRIYEETGLVIPARTEGNTRLFSNADIEILQHIRFLIQEKGLNLAGVKLILMVEEKLSIRIEEWFE